MFEKMLALKKRIKYKKYIGILYLDENCGSDNPS